MKLNKHTVATRYATALFDLAKQADQVDAVAAELSVIKTAFDENPQFITLLTATQIPVAARNQALADLKQLVASSLVKNLLQMTNDYGRWGDLSAIITAYLRKQDEYHQIVRATVTTAVALQDDQADKLAATFAGVVGAKKVVLTQKLDPAIIGGVVLKSDSYIYDGSLATKLANIKRLLLK